MKRLCYIIVFILLGIIATELFLRSIFGFCDSPLCFASSNYEYIYAPNQDRYRFRKHIIYNEYSQRNGKVDKSKKRILGLGDSVLNGGVLTDQSELATTILSDNTNIQILNISAGSWGPDNCAAYLLEHGSFGASAMILIVSSHDAHDNMDFQPVVDVHPSYPSKQYISAIVELVDRFLLPRLIGVFEKAQLDPDQKVSSGITKQGLTFNQGFLQLYQFSLKNKIPITVYLHPELEELKIGHYNSQGDEIIEWCNQKKISLIQGILYEKEDGFRDNIHLNATGQKRLAQILKSELLYFQN